MFVTVALFRVGNDQEGISDLSNHPSIKGRCSKDWSLSSADQDSKEIFELANNGFTPAHIFWQPHWFTKSNLIHDQPASTGVLYREAPCVVIIDLFAGLMHFLQNPLLMNLQIGAFLLFIQYTNLFLSCSRYQSTSLGRYLLWEWSTISKTFTRQISAACWNELLISRVSVMLSQYIILEGACPTEFDQGLPRTFLLFSQIPP